MIIQPKGKQAEVLALPNEGHYVVLGTAGSGKTTIALLRAINLANLPGNNKVLLVTFNRALVQYIKETGFLKGNLTVENYHKFARGYLANRGKMPIKNGIAENKEREELIDLAVVEMQEKYPDESTFQRKNAFFYDELKFMEEFGCNSIDSYLNIERIGRSEANLKKEKRTYVYMVYEAYKKLREKRCKKYDWYDLALYVENEFAHDNSKRMYKHVVIDEGQDFSPMMIKSLIKAIPEDGSFTFFGDVAQQIYGNRMSWKESGIRVPNIWRFPVNYRNPETIVSFSKELCNSKFWTTSEDMVECEEANAVGPKPVLLKFDNESKEREWVVNRAISESQKSSVVIVCRNREDIDIYEREIKKRGYSPVEINKDTAGFCNKKQVYLSTYHAIKGMEFYNVFIPSLTKNKLPDSEMLQRAENKQDVYADELKLLYVAVTRSKYGLYMSYYGELTELFPQNTDTVEIKEMQNEHI